MSKCQCPDCVLARAAPDMLEALKELVNNPGAIAPVNRAKRLVAELEKVEEE